MLDHQIIGYIRSFIYHLFPDSFSIVDVFSIPRLPHLGAHPLAILSISLHRVGGKLIFPAIFPLFVLSSQLHYRPFNHCTLGGEKAKSLELGGNRSNPVSSTRINCRFVAPGATWLADTDIFSPVDRAKWRILWACHPILDRILSPLDICGMFMKI